MAYVLLRTVTNFRYSPEPLPTSFSVSIQTDTDLFLTHFYVIASPVYQSSRRVYLKHSKSLHNFPIHPNSTQLFLFKHYPDFTAWIQKPPHHTSNKLEILNLA